MKPPLITINTHLRQLKHISEQTLQEITRDDYQMFINEFDGDKAKETVEKVNSHIRTCVSDAVEEQIVHYDFTRKTVLTWTVPAKKSNEKHLSFNDSELLLNEVWKKLDKGLGYSLLLLGLTSGMRFGEMLGLTKKDFDFIKDTITVNKTCGYLKAHSEGFGPTKNEQSNRTIKINS